MYEMRFIVKIVTYKNIVFKYVYATGTRRDMKNIVVEDQVCKAAKLLIAASVCNGT